MLQIFNNLFHYKNIVTVQWIKRLKLCMVTMVTPPPAKELKIQVVSWQNEIRTLDVLNCPTWFNLVILIGFLPNFIYGLLSSNSRLSSNTFFSLCRTISKKAKKMAAAYQCPGQVTLTN